MRDVIKDGIKFTVDESPGTFWGMWDFWASNQWEPTTIEEMERILKPGSTLLDIGAWVGPLTLWAAAKCGATVIAVEPDPFAYKELENNILASNLAHLAFPLRVAVTRETGTVRFNLTEMGGDGYSSMSRPLTRVIEVEGRTLISLVEQFEPDLIKIDIEAGEVQILPDASAYLRERGIPLLLALHWQWYDQEGKEAIEEELTKWHVKDLFNEMYLLTP